MKTERKLKELGIELVKPTSPMANYVNAVRTGNLLYLAGKGPGLPGKPLPVGKVGRDFTVEQGYQCARETGLSLIAVMKAELGDLDRVKRIVKVEDAPASRGQKRAAAAAPKAAARRKAAPKAKKKSARKKKR